ncbi:unnamed protein product [Closterium sp. Naga37s-1]|nr:unnamed protein product [Closterium sp. Naga37s-1]
MHSGTCLRTWNALNPSPSSHIPLCFPPFRPLLIPYTSLCFLSFPPYPSLCLPMHLPSYPSPSPPVSPHFRPHLTSIPSHLISHHSMPPHLSFQPPSPIHASHLPWDLMAHSASSKMALAPVPISIGDAVWAELDEPHGPWPCEVTSLDDSGSEGRVGVRLCGMNNTVTDSVSHSRIHTWASGSFYFFAESQTHQLEEIYAAQAEGQAIFKRLQGQVSHSSGHGAAHRLRWAPRLVGVGKGGGRVETAGGRVGGGRGGDWRRGNGRRDVGEGGWEKAG